MDAAIVLPFRPARGYRLEDASAWKGSTPSLPIRLLACSSQRSASTEWKKIENSHAVQTDWSALQLRRETRLAVTGRTLGAFKENMRFYHLYR
jgi:hypothetical protein